LLLDWIIIPTFWWYWMKYSCFFFDQFYPSINYCWLIAAGVKLLVQ
jgi:hypothetical protein